MENVDMINEKTELTLMVSIRNEEKVGTIAIGFELILSGHVVISNLSCCGPFQDTSLEKGRTNQITS